MANDAIDLDIVPGEIHCLLGENGAGKSTLMNVLYGLLQPDEGTITIDGVPHVSRNPGEAIAAGIGMVHQHFMLVEVFTVAENLVLGRERGTPGSWTCAGPGGRCGSSPSATGWTSTRTRWSRTCRSGCSSGWRSSRPWPTTRST